MPPMPLSIFGDFPRFLRFQNAKVSVNKDSYNTLYSFSYSTATGK